MKSTEIAEQLLKYKEAYYNDDPQISDQNFDLLEEELRKLDPENEYFSIVGIPAKGEKIKHQVKMLSMNKAKTIEEVETWLNKIIDKKIELIIEPKIDGLSCSIVYDKGKLQYIATRGDGKEGRIITHIKDYVDIPKIISITERIEIRGELFLPKKSNFPNPENKPLRNLAVGLINRKDEGLEDLKYIKFIAYQVIGSLQNKESDKIDFLINHDFNSFFYNLVITIEEIKNYFELYKSSFREKWEFETDGLVIAINDNTLYEEIDSKYVIDHHHHYAIALKPESESKWTSIVGLTWQVSKAGKLIPVVELDPINIGGSEIKRVTANNYENVEKLKLNIGDKIHVSRSNEIIPYLIETIPIKDRSELIPTNCPSCNSKLTRDGVHLVCTNLYCPEKNIQLITSWAVDCEMEDVSEATIRLLYNFEFIKDISDLYTLEEFRSYINALPGFGEKKTNNLFKQIEKSKKMTIVQFLARLGIDRVGEKAIVKLGIKSIQDFWNFNDNQYVIGQNLITYREKNKLFLAKLSLMLNIQEIKDTQIKGKICMTGEGHAGRKELIKELEQMGYEFVSGVTKETNILITDDINSNTGKMKKAQSLGIKIMSYEQFFK